MITLEGARAKHLATIINLRQAVYDKYHDEYDPYMDEKHIRWELVERPNSFYYFVKDGEEIVDFLRLNTNEERTEVWLGTAAFLPPVPATRLWY